MRKSGEKISNAVVTYQVSDLVRDIRVLLDYNEEDEQLVQYGDGDSLSISTLIESKIAEAARQVYLSAPLSLLPPTQLTGSITWEQRAHPGGRIVLPADFMKLLSFRMSDWEQTVHEAIGVDDALYEQQGSRFAGVRGNPQRPVCAIVPDGGGLALEFYACQNAEATISTALYAAYPGMENGLIALAPKLLDDIERVAGGLVCRSLGDENGAMARLKEK